MNCIKITILLILLLILTLICIYHHSKDDESFQYANLYNYYNRYPRGYDYYNRYPKRGYNYYQKSKINPGFGNKMWELESAPDCSGIIDLNNLQPGDFGRYVSCAEGRNNATAIKNLNV